jgi:hypothetical protein
MTLFFHFSRWSCHCLICGFLGGWVVLGRECMDCMDARVGRAGQVGLHLLSLPRYLPRFGLAGYLIGVVGWVFLMDWYRQSSTLAVLASE